MRVLALLVVALLATTLAPLAAATEAGVVYVCNESNGRYAVVVVQSEPCGLSGPSNVIVGVCVDRSHPQHDCM